MKTRVGILGIGGIGGFLGAKLAARYSSSEDVEVIFIARGEHAEVIRQKGLTLVTPDREETAAPDLVTDDPSQIGTVDYLICAVKTYHLDSAMDSVRPCVWDETVIVPLLNGVDGRERIETKYPNVEVWDGCVYIMARLKEPGVVEELGKIHQYHFGSEQGSTEKLKAFEQMLIKADVEAYRSDNILQTIWDKFLLISSVASLTSYLDLAISDIFANEEHKKTLVALIKELKAVGEAKGVVFSEGVIEKTLKILRSSPPGTTSSMHSDYTRGSQTEYKALTEYITTEGKRLNIPTPNYDVILEELRSR